MEEVDKHPEEASEPSVLFESQEAKNGVSTQEVEEDPSMEVHEEVHEEVNEEVNEEVSQPLEEEEEEEEEEESEKPVAPQSMSDLQRHLTTLVSNVQTAADAKESMRRTELEEAHRIRLERQENDIKSSQEIFEELTNGWAVVQQRMTAQELQEALTNQQQLCAAHMEVKKKIINDLRQELKVGDDRYVKDFRKQAEELDLMMERIEDQIKTLRKAYREEQVQMERVYQQEHEMSLTRDGTEWEQHLKEFWEEELERLTQRRKTVEEYEATIHNLMLETTDKFSLLQTEENAKFQALEREHQQIKANHMITKLKIIKQKDEIAGRTFNLAQIKSRIHSLQAEVKDLNSKTSSQAKELTKKSQYLSKEYERSIQQYERIQRKNKRFADIDARKFENMWLMAEAEVKQLVEKALVIDSLICSHLGLAWERPPMEFMELSGPVQLQKQALQPSCPAASQLFYSGQSSQRMMERSVGPRLETDTERMEVYKEGTEVQSESGAEVEEGKPSMETLMKVMEVLCDEAGFLIEDKLLNLLAHLETEEQAVVKLNFLLCSFGIEERDVPKLASFLLKYKHQQKEQTEDVYVESGESSNNAEEQEPKSTTHLTSELINPHHVVPALKSFLEQHMRSRESSAHRHHSFHLEAQDTSQEAAYWESMANIISEDKIKLWDAAENTLNQFQEVLTEILELDPETQSLEQQNAELRMLLQRSLNP